MNEVRVFSFKRYNYVMDDLLLGPKKSDQTIKDGTLTDLRVGCMVSLWRHGTGHGRSSRTNKSGTNEWISVSALLVFYSFLYNLASLHILYIWSNVAIPADPSNQLGWMETKVFTLLFLIPWGELEWCKSCTHLCWSVLWLRAQGPPAWLPA